MNLFFIILLMIYSRVCCNESYTGDILLNFETDRFIYIWGKKVQQSFLGLNLSSLIISTFCRTSDVLCFAALFAPVCFSLLNFVTKFLFAQGLLTNVLDTHPSCLAQQSTLRLTKSRFSDLSFLNRKYHLLH